MTYFDTAYIAKCYLPEPGSEQVQELARSAENGLCCSEWGRIELCSVFHRHLQEGRIDRGNLKDILSVFHADEAAGVWTWFPVGSSLLRSVADTFIEMPDNLFLRAGDALHLRSAAAYGLNKIYTSDRHLLAAADRFGIIGMNILEQ
jgi:predicted nucleic acid-binding protein